MKLIALLSIVAAYNVPQHLSLWLSLNPKYWLVDRKGILSQVQPGIPLTVCLALEVLLSRTERCSIDPTTCGEKRVNF